MNDQQDDAHNLLPDEMASQIPQLYATQNDKDPMAVLKWFTPDSSWTWYVCEYSPDERLCFGLVIGHERELGYFSLDEIESVRGPFGLAIERDLYFESKPVSQCQ